MPGKASSPGGVLVFGAVSCLGLTFHPNGQPYLEHWQACKATVEQQTGALAWYVQELARRAATIAAQDARIKKLLSKCGSKCKGL